ncbi:hypothetical protein [Iningainema tapete]|uniref:Uncharacterized protein n=1 Tax=Iningainema tapete BLCC-T55 TaxID=2748662 RepID=A0A8J6XDX2_9CYAN|nr:hypothetical protein [Iningainema tapete]MBD2771205.1 hypothetical protein [Iningainema tapete BLCC-T55]
MKISAIQRHELERELVTILAQYEGFEVNPNTIHTSSNPRTKRWLELAKQLINSVEQVICDN